MSIWKRISNLWKWSGIDPYERRTWDENMDVESATNSELHQIKAQYEKQQEAQIIYPNPREEILKVKPNASLDEITNV